MATTTLATVDQNTSNQQTFLNRLNTKYHGVMPWDPLMGLGEQAIDTFINYIQSNPSIRDSVDAIEQMLPDSIVRELKSPTSQEWAIAQLLKAASNSETIQNFVNEKLNIDSAITSSLDGKFKGGALQLKSTLTDDHFRMQGSGNGFVIDKPFENLPFDHQLNVIKGDGNLNVTTKGIDVLGEAKALNLHVNFGNGYAGDFNIVDVTGYAGAGDAFTINHDNGVKSALQIGNSKANATTLQAGRQFSIASGSLSKTFTVDDEKIATIFFKIQGGTKGGTIRITPTRAEGSIGLGKIGLGLGVNLDTSKYPSFKEAIEDWLNKNGIK